MTDSILKYLPSKRAKRKLVQAWISMDVYEEALKCRANQDFTWKELIEALLKAYIDESNSSPKAKAE